MLAPRQATVPSGLPFGTFGGPLGGAHWRGGWEEARSVSRCLARRRERRTARVAGAAAGRPCQQRSACCTFVPLLIVHSLCYSATRHSNVLPCGTAEMSVFSWRSLPVRLCRPPPKCRGGASHDGGQAGCRRAAASAVGRAGAGGTGSSLPPSRAAVAGGLAGRLDRRPHVGCECGGGAGGAVGSARACCCWFGTCFPAAHGTPGMAVSLEEVGNSKLTCALSSTHSLSKKSHPDISTFPNTPTCFRWHSLHALQRQCRVCLHMHWDGPAVGLACCRRGGQRRQACARGVEGSGCASLRHSCRRCSPAMLAGHRHSSSVTSRARVCPLLATAALARLLSYGLAQLCQGA